MNNEDIIDKNEAESDLQRLKDLEAVGNSKGGKMILEAIESDVSSILQDLTVKYADMPEMEMRSKLAKIGVNISLLRLISKAASNALVIEEHLKKLIE